MKRAALQRVLESRTFARSEQLKAFLRFVCEWEIEGRGGELSEYVIGVEVLGRPEGYSPGEDSAVRTRAYELRQRLQKLYLGELKDEELRIVLRKGSYVPDFQRPECEPKHPSGGRRWWIGAAACALALAGVFVGVLLGRSGGTKALGIDPVVLEAWRPMARPDANVALSVAAPLHLILGPGGHKPYRNIHGLPLYPAPVESYEIYQQHRTLPEGQDLTMTFTDNALGFGTMEAVVSTVTTLRWLGAGYQIVPDRAMPISAMRERNVVLFGGGLDSKTIARTMENVPFVVDFDPLEKYMVVRDRRSGRRFIPRPGGPDGFSDVYGLVTVLNTRDGEKGRLGTVIFSGTNSAGANGAARYLTTPRSLEELKAVFRKEGLPGFPAAYQVVVRCAFGDLLMISYSYAAHTVIQR